MRLILMGLLLLATQTLPAQVCNNWLNNPSLGSSFQVGDLDISGNQLTVEATFNRTQPYSGSYVYAGDLVSKHLNPTNVNYLLRPNSAEITNTNGTYFATPPICDIQLNKTYHVAMTYDGVTLKFYRNGFLMSAVPASGNLYQNDFITSIGEIAQDNTLNTTFKGFINEVRIWNVVRTQAQIKTYMNTSLPNPTTQVGLQAYYTFDNLLNKQGNAAWNGHLMGAAAINATNTSCNMVIDTCGVVPVVPLNVTASFNAPATVCVNTPVQVTNTSQNATNYFWSFCETNFQTTPDATNLGNVGSVMSMPVFSDLVQDQNGDYYAFVTNHVPEAVIRYKYGNSYLNTPTTDYLGNFGGMLVLHPEDIKVVKAGNNWIGVVVGGSPTTEQSMVTIINFGPNIKNNTPVVNSYANIGGMAFPLGLSVFFDNGKWGGYAANTRNNTITKFDFGTDFSAPPTAVNLGNLGGLNIPTGIGEIKDNGNWHLFVANEGDNSITRLDFGSSLNNVPTAVNIPSPGGIINHPRDISFIRLCNGVSAFVPNAGTQTVVKLDFGNNILGTPVATDLGNIGNFAFPHSISNLFRVNNDIYTFITNVSNNTMTRLRFAGCQTIPGSSQQNPGPITYTQPGTYNINLTVDIGLPTQTSFCRQIVVNSCQPVVTAAFTAPATVCVNAPVQVTNTSQNATNYFWSFCETNFQNAPTANNLGNVGGALSLPVFSDLIKDDAGNYYAFVTNHVPAGITRFNYGNSYLNTPTTTPLGNFGGVLVSHPEGIKVVKSGNNYIAVVVGGNPQVGDQSKVTVLNFGTNINNNSPVVNSYANVGNMDFPVDLSLFYADGGWHAYTVNTRSYTITKLDFGADFSAPPTGTNLGNLGNLNIPTGMGEINNNGNWHIFITNEGSNSLTRLDFGTSLNNVPTAVNIPNPNGVLAKPRDISFIRLCDGVTGFIPNGTTASIVKLDFGNNILNTPTATDLGNIGNFDFPHSISNLFRVDNDIYTFVTNVNNNTITRLRFPGCQTIPGSSQQNPGPITYSQPGTYNINLTVDIGLPTQTSFCRQIVVNSCQPVVTPAFTAPATVCINTPVQVNNTSSGATNYFWSFCETTFQTAPAAVNAGNPSNILAKPVFSDLVKDAAGNYYAFITNHEPEALVRLNYGNSYLNTPTVQNLGNFGGILVRHPEGIKVVKAGSNWVAVIVGGNPTTGDVSKLSIVNFGANLTNNAPAITSYDNVGGIDFPHDLCVFNSDNRWFGYTVNSGNSTLTKFDFGTDFTAAPTATNLGTPGGLSAPLGIAEISNNGTWYMFVTNTNNTLTRFEFGSSLNNIFTATNIGNPGNILNAAMDIGFIKLCDGISALAVNAGNNTIVKLDFQNNLTGTPVTSSYGNIGNLDFPHSISSLFRIDNDIYSLITNVNNNTITRLRFAGCQTIPGSSLQNPGVITYNTPGTYNINLTVDIGLPTQASTCRQIVVTPCVSDTIVNEYTPAISFDICKNIINVGDASKFNAGDTVMLIQMKGAVIDSTNTAAFGTVLNYKNAGFYEFNIVKSKNGGALELLHKLTHQYDFLQGKVQLIRIPYFTNLATDKKLTCPVWDGNKGGVLALNVQQNLTLKADIDVSGKGFRGGALGNNLSNTQACGSNDYYYPLSSTLAAPKGEGITSLLSDRIKGKGAYANGGGGGLDHNSGGAGGGNGGTGGKGGDQFGGCGTPLANGGLGGKLLPQSTTANRIFMGGGGGSGHANNAAGFNPDGGNGGGIVIISTPLLTNNGFSILANGAEGKGCTSNSGNNNCNEGMGGGGAGGTVVLNVDNFANANLPVVAKGAAGTNVSFFDAAATYRHGPGGGGGGGSLWMKQNAPAANVQPNLTGGTNGVNIFYGNDAWGATAGQAGGTTLSLVLPVDVVPFKPNIDSVRFASASGNCRAFNFNGLGYTNTSGIAGWQWTFGDGGSANTQNTSHTYTTAGTYQVKLIITDINGCKDSIINPVTATVVTVNAGLDTAYCTNGNAVRTLHATGAGPWLWTPAAYLDNNTSQNPVATVNVTTKFYVTLTDAAGCSGTDSITIAVKPLPNVRTLQDSAICKGSTIILTTTGAGSYSWTPAIYVNNPSAASPSFIDANSQTLYVAGTGANGCIGKDTINITVKPLPVVTTIKDSIICSTASIVLTANGAQTYSWTPATALSSSTAQNPVLSGLQNNTTYIVTGTAANRCSAKDTVKITIRAPFTFAPPPDKEVCFKESVTLNGNNGPNVTYSWSPAATLSNAGIVNPVASPRSTQTYTVTITDAVCHYNTDFPVLVTVNPLPTIDASKSNDINCAITSAKLAAVGGSQYSWTPASTLTGANSAMAVAKPNATTLYTVIGTDLKGCKNADTIRVIVNKSSGNFSIPNTFTPNNDGKNECFGVKHWGDVTNLTFIIYNRLGEKVFETNNPNVCWDGRYKGQPADQGTYVYYIKGKVSCGELIQKGNVLLLR